MIPTLAHHQTLQLESLLWWLSPFIWQSIKFYCPKYTTEPVQKGSLAVCSLTSPTRCTGHVMVETKSQFGLEKRKEISIKKGRNSASCHGCSIGIYSSRWDYLMVSCHRNGLWNTRDMSIYLFSQSQGTALRIFFVQQLWLPFPNAWQNIRDGTLHPSFHSGAQPWTSLRTRVSQQKIHLNLCSGDTQMWSPGASLTTAVITIHYFQKVHNWIIFLFWLLWRTQSQVSTGC